MKSRLLWRGRLILGCIGLLLLTAFASGAAAIADEGAMAVPLALTPSAPENLVARNQTELLAQAIAPSNTLAPDTNATLATTNRPEPWPARVETSPPSPATNNNTVPSVRGLVWFIAGALMVLVALVLVARKLPANDK